MISDVMTKMLALKILKFDDGIISIKDRIVIFMPSEILLYMQEKMEENTDKKTAEQFMVECGRYQTLTGSVKYFMEKKELKTMFKKVSETGDASIEMGREVLKFAGWGDTRIKEIANNGKKILLMTKNSPLAEEFNKTRGKSNGPVCHYMRGLLEGVIEAVYKGKYQSKELSCKAAGLSDHCSFEFVRKD